MKINLEVELEGQGKTEVVCTASDIVKFEDKFNISIANATRDLKVTHLLYLAHASLTRQKKTAQSFEEWVDTVEGIDVGAIAPKSKG